MSPVLTFPPASISTSVTVPDNGDLISVSIFIASTTAITSPSATLSPTETFTLITFPGSAALTGLPSPLPPCVDSIPFLTSKS